MHWKSKIYNTAVEIAKQFIGTPKVVAVAIGGSIGRGATWKHSDLELCLVVEERLESFPYFNYMNDMGVEIIQIPLSRMNNFIDQFQPPDRGMLKFPIQIYQCKIIHDPEKVLSKFKAIYDKYLMHESVTARYKERHLTAADNRFSIAKEAVSAGYFRTGLGHMRLAVNDLLLAYYWHHHIFPRSQNRTVHFLNKNCKVIGHDKLYQAFKLLYCLNEPLARMKASLLRAQDELYDLTEKMWGTGAPDFLHKAVDSQLAWGYPKSSIFVYKWCVHLLQCGEQVIDIYDQDSYRKESPHLYQFLDMEGMTAEKVGHMIVSYEEARSLLSSDERSQ